MRFRIAEQPRPASVLFTPLASSGLPINFSNHDGHREFTAFGCG